MSSALFPDIPDQHLTRDGIALIAEKILEQIEFSGSKVECVAAANSRTSDNIHLQVGDFESCLLVRFAAPQQDPNSRQQLRERKGFNQIVIGAAIQPQHAIFNCISCCEL